MGKQSRAQQIKPSQGWDGNLLTPSLPRRASVSPSIAREGLGAGQEGCQGPLGAGAWVPGPLSPTLRVLPPWACCKPCSSENCPLPFLLFWPAGLGLRRPPLPSPLHPAAWPLGPLLVLWGPSPSPSPCHRPARSQTWVGKQAEDQLSQSRSRGRGSPSFFLK